MNIQASVLDLREGDTLVVHVEQFLLAEQRSKLAEMFKGKFSHAREIVILEGGMRLSTARPGGDELLTDIRDTLLRLEKSWIDTSASTRKLAEQFNSLTAGGNSILVENA